MANLHGFDASQVEPASVLGPIPAGKYLAEIQGSERKPNKSGTGELLEFRFRIVEGEFNNHTLLAWLNMKNPNPIAVEIARAELSAICRSVGVMKPKDSAELHNLPLIIHVRCKKREDNGELANEVVGYSSKETLAPNTQAVGDSTPPQKPQC